MASNQSSVTLPKGFSVYQPALGAPLQFFPALGSQQLDDLINAFVPGPSHASEKRATISLDFLEHAHMTGQTFKFYAVHSAPSVGTPASIDSPSLDSVSSSLNVSPITSTWDWSATSAPSVASSSRGSTQRRRQSKMGSPTSRHHTTDFSSLPGMKILTKDGLDVTNSASRGSKTKEQRDHAHLMRIIKACDSCRRKKIRCDPSHKKRGAAQVTPQPAPKPAKKARTVSHDAPPPPCPLPATVADAELLFTTSSFDLDSSFDFTGFGNLDPTSLPYDLFDEFVQFPSLDTPDYDLFLDSGEYLPSQPTTTASSSSAASPLKSFSPVSQQEPGAPPGAESVNPELQERWSNFPFPERSGSSSDYTDFNLYSPRSSFSEDERMLPIGTSSVRLRGLNEPSMSECPPPSFESIPDGEASECDGPGLSADFSANSLLGSSGHGSLSSSGSGSGSGLYATTIHAIAGDAVEEYGSRPTRVPVSALLSHVVPCCPRGTAVFGEKAFGDGVPDNLSISRGSSAVSTSIDVGASESSGISGDELIASSTSSATGRVGSGQSAEPPGQSAFASGIMHRSISSGDELQSLQLLLSTTHASDSREASASSRVHTRPTGIEGPMSNVSYALSGTSDGLVRDTAPAPPGPTYEQLQASTLSTQTRRFSSSASSDVTPGEHGEPGPDVAGGDSVDPQTSRRTTRPFPEQIRNRHRDHRMPAPISPRGTGEQLSHISPNAPLHVSTSVTGEHLRQVDATPVPLDFKLSRIQSECLPEAQSDTAPAFMAQVAAFMSHLALNVVATAMTATDSSTSPRAQSAVPSCRTMTRRSSFKLEAMSSLCVA
ncbi:Zn(2)-C6 fungal-type DNA-binding domain protein [Metarhizium rileyi]|uniref:Zn(2)-C6 fungal-type DNA-binding domain protein n=1 Tax=Metarhizium rileyi (strain RCEF 4871) TaxID=1649241 RepID=A0A166X4M7_METRR|nr:Zn(2)-C6 fungal-type DNA-binding domain protein [Metarhizium rileyi RCEF 4871]